MGEYNSEKAKQRLLKRIRQDKRNLRSKFVLRSFQYVVVGLIFLGLGYTYYTSNATKKSVENMVSDKNAITLQVSDGSIKTILEEGSISILDIKGNLIALQKGNLLVHHKAVTTNEITYNTLKVPYGKKFGLILSDGSIAHLNSGTTLKYPVQFKKGGTREVFLEGEGYFEVATDKTHPFIVNANTLGIRVLGTKFNVSAYADDENISTVLVDGSVGFFEKDETFDAVRNQRLNPGHIAIWQKRNGSMHIEEADTDLYTGWMDGRILFHHMPFKEIRKKLERNYNVSIFNGYQELDEVRFTASFDTETIGQVLQAIHKNYPIRYTKNNRKIHIQKP